MTRLDPQRARFIGRLALLAALVFAGGCATTEQAREDGDPLEPGNRDVYDFNDSLDRNFIKPVAETYADITPAVLRTGVSNFFDNVSYLNVILNDLLQFKLVQFLSDSGRFIVNSTIGIGGLFDPATSMGLVENNEDLGQTFGTWGAEEGAYLVLPLVGPNSVRDAPDMATSILLNPLTYLGAPITVPLGLLNAVNSRANLLDATDFRDQAALDPYTFVREAYRQRREFLIYDGDPPSDGYDEFIEEDAGNGDSESGPGSVLKVF